MNTITIHRPGLLGHKMINDALINLFGNEHFMDTAIKDTVKGYPVADIYSNEDGSTIMEFALAGFKREELSVDVRPDKRSITVSADPDGQGDAAQRRIARRSFQKKYVNYDGNLDLSNTEASYQDGLLVVVVPKKQEAKPLSINIS